MLEANDTKQYINYLATHKMTLKDCGGYPDCFIHCVADFMMDYHVVLPNPSQLRKLLVQPTMELLSEDIYFDDAVRDVKETQNKEISNRDNYIEQLLGDLFIGLFICNYVNNHERI